VAASLASWMVVRMLVEAQASLFSLMNSRNDAYTSYAVLSYVTLFSVFVCIPFIVGISQFEKTSLLLSSYIFTEAQQRVFQQAVAFTTPISLALWSSKKAPAIYNYVAPKIMNVGNGPSVQVAPKTCSKPGFFSIMYSSLRVEKGKRWRQSS
jgi:hypothetical protein